MDERAVLEEITNMYICDKYNPKEVSDQKEQIKKLSDNLKDVQSKVESLTMKVRLGSYALPFTTEGLSWAGNPVGIGWVKSAPGVQSFALPDNFPSDARMVRIVAFHRSGSEGSSREVLYRLWTEVDGEEHVHFLFGWRYTQPAISFQSPEIWFPLSQKNRVLKASTDSIQPTNDHGVSLYVSGYNK